MEKHQIIQWGIIGCGDVTERKSGPAFNKVLNSKLVAVMRRDAAKAADYARRHGVPRWYHQADALINDPGVNAIYVATPPDSHLMYTQMALEAGKPVYVEKPMTLNSIEAGQMLQLADKFENNIVVAHYRRCWPQFQKVKQLIDEGAIGKPIRAHLVCTRKPLTADDMQKPGVQWRINPGISGGGLFHDLAPHQLDLLLYWFGDVESCSGHSFNHAALYDADDVVVGSIRFTSGVSVFGCWNFAVPSDVQEDYVMIEGEKGSIRCSIFWEHDVVLKNEGGTKAFSFVPPEHNQIYLIEQVVNFFRGRSENPCPVSEGLKGMQLMDAMTKRPH